MAMSIDLPVVDVRGAAAAVRQACVEHGFFYVSNHGVDGALLDAVFAESRRFFEQPTEGKMALRRGSNHRGYTPPYVKKLDAASQFEGDLKETFYIGPDLNQWPSEVLFPSWKDTMKLYQSSALVVGEKILSLIALSLDLDAEYFQKIGALNCPSAFVQLLCYPGEVNEADNGNFGASAHSDYGMITLLATDGTPGFRYATRRIGIHSYGKMFLTLMEPLLLTSVIYLKGGQIVYSDLHFIGLLQLVKSDVLLLSFLIQTLIPWCSALNVVAVRQILLGQVSPNQEC